MKTSSNPGIPGLRSFAVFGAALFLVSCSTMKAQTKNSTSTDCDGAAKDNIIDVSQSDVSCKLAFVSKVNSMKPMLWQAKEPNNYNIKIQFSSNNLLNPFPNMSKCDGTTPTCESGRVDLSAPTASYFIYLYDAFSCTKANPPVCTQVRDPGVIINP